MKCFQRLDEKRHKPTNLLAIAPKLAAYSERQMHQDERSVVTRPELLAQLTNTSNNYVLGLAALSLFATPEVYPILETQSAGFGPYTVKFIQVSRLLSATTDRDIALKEFLTMLLRALIKESFALITDYSEQSEQALLFKCQTWYPFARIIRNCISHNFHFEFNSYDKGLLPVTWRDRTITTAMNSQPLPLSFFGYKEAWVLFSEFNSFASGQLRQVR